MIPDYTWKRLWGTSITDFLKLKGLVSSYTTYLSSKELSLKYTLDKYFNKKITLKESIFNYVQWVALGPSLVDGFSLLNFLKNDKPSYVETMKNAVEKLSSNPSDWSGSIFESFSNYSDKIKPIFIGLKYKKSFEELNTEIQRPTDRLTIPSSYILGILSNKTVWTPPECTNAAINIVKKGVEGQALHFMDSKPFLSEFKDSPRNKWKNQEESLRKELQKDLGL